MTNEQLAALISEGGNDELIPLLWERIRKLVRSVAQKFYVKNQNLCASHGVGADDLLQVGYFAFLQAIKYYAKSKKYCITTFLNLPLKTEFAKALNSRTKDGMNEPLNSYTSLDLPFNHDEAEGATLLEIIPDPSEISQNEVIEKCFTKHMRMIIDIELMRLNEKQRNVIIEIYLNGSTYGMAAEKLNIPLNRIRGIEREALHALRYSFKLQQLYKGLFD